MAEPAPTGGRDDPALLMRLFSWMSPAFPLGGFAYSQGLETVIANGALGDDAALERWIEGLVHAGSLRTDAYFLAIAHRAVETDDAAGFAAASALALALQVSAERDAETRAQATAFLEAAAAWPAPRPPWLADALGREAALPVAVGALAACHGLARLQVLAGYIQALAAQQISVAVRLVPLGQRRGLEVQARLEPLLADLARAAQDATLADIGSLAYGADIASMQHEHLTTRIFRS